MSVPEQRFAIVTTTINVPHLLQAYADDAARFGRHVQFVVVGDNKTPEETSDFCTRLDQESPYRCTYLSPQDQREILGIAPSFESFLPWNCIQRRNVGMYYAYQQSVDVVITIDDDNLLCDTDYLGRHAHVGTQTTVPALHSENGWWNVCELLNEAKQLPFYHRGHPLSKRWQPDEDFTTISPAQGRVVVNAGLWLDDPDIDAVSRLFAPIRTTGRNEKFPATLALERGTWAPFNSQNTALARDVIPAYLLFPHFGRYDDIWASYVVRRLADSHGDLVTYGTPLVRQKRNEHNLLQDLDAERVGMEYTEAFCEALNDCTVTSTSYLEGFREIGGQLEEALEARCDQHKLTPAALAPIIKGFHEWSKLF